MLTIRKLTFDEAEAVTCFIEKQLATIKEGFFFPPNSSIVSKALNADTGISFGAYDGKELIGVRLTYIPGLDKDNHGYDLGYSLDELLLVAQFHGTLVKDDNRYKGIGHELVKTNCDEIFTTKFKIILVTVHPQNDVSIRLFQKNGFITKKLVNKYSNLPRLIFERRKSE